MVYDRKKDDKKYYEKNKAKILEHQKIYSREWIKENQEKYRERTRNINNKEETNLRKNKWANENREKVLESRRKNQDKYRMENEDKVMAQQIAKSLELKQQCEIYGSTKNLGRHHWRYDKPLLVNTLCSTCHRIQHLKNFETSRFAGGGENR